MMADLLDVPLSERGFGTNEALPHNWKRPHEWEPNSEVCLYCGMTGMAFLEKPQDCPGPR